ncbi:MAG: CHAT domain-containing protein [Nitrospirae bacterium]|uniref:CHAT domain-containing protein n=1 Tax=Candidatus Magnetobacterium casense TaxID=1455061 RepID=UPI0005909857|nr:CHAT domain-containing protein [Candidatus Magnetobacterium casensis]MBF0337979.1 CHAT domain-containing protein [Nitrospirota bacterium]
MGNNDSTKNIRIRISDAAGGKYQVHINDEMSHNINEYDVATLLKEANNNLWCYNSDAGADIGRRLYDLLNGSAGMLQGIINSSRGAGVHTNLYIQTSRELMQLPFELLNNGDWVLLNRNIHIIRLIDDRNKLNLPKPKKEPLRMLFMACSPTDTHEKYVLDFEKEEEYILGAFDKHNINIDMRIEDTGSLNGLEQVNIECRGFDIIHITSHGGIDRVLGPVLYMEDDAGKTEKVAPRMLWDKIKIFPPRVLFLSGCFTGNSDDSVASESFASEMVKRGVSWVIGWGLSVIDKHATIAAAELYLNLSTGKGIAEAIQIVRKEVEAQVEDRYYPWPLLRLFGDASPTVPLVVDGLPKKSNLVKLKHKTLQDSNVRVLESGFIGRRRYVQRGVRVLRGEFVHQVRLR